MHLRMILRDKRLARMILWLVAMTVVWPELLDNVFLNQRHFGPFLDSILSWRIIAFNSSPITESICTIRRLENP